MSTRRDNPYWRSKHERISEAAFDEFTIHGFELASMEKIAERAGVSKVTVYNHFETKDRLFFHTFEYFFEFNFQGFTFEPVQVPKNDRGMFAAFVSGLVEHLLLPPNQAMMHLLRSEQIRIKMLGVTKSEADLYPREMVTDMASMLPFGPARSRAVAELVFSLIYRRCALMSPSESALKNKSEYIAKEVLTLVDQSGLMA